MTHAQSRRRPLCIVAVQCPLPPLMLMRMTAYPGVTNNIQARNLKYSAQRDYNYLEREYLSIL